MPNDEDLNLLSDMRERRDGRRLVAKKVGDGKVGFLAWTGWYTCPYRHCEDSRAETSKKKTPGRQEQEEGKEDELRSQKTKRLKDDAG